ncbi:CheY-like chemotaxis protein [Sphingomonas jejuensis]|uniref:CheY-like chemotaxis protein n=1 Tax=Sphingomonas jejuensis TaxID=904715 RepID=A0ABX0XK50_9SPHN|nr:response regulator [Sphingomonas jejuensis]NJC33219.1 CheY-like chemotaxis protein [Sphingomonas jejuensis]
MNNSPSILIVEDEPLISMMLEDFLDSLGYRVAGTADGVGSALDLVSRGEFDAAILDVNLRGGEPSWPVADALADKDLPFVLATGGTGSDRPSRHGTVPVLAKPFTMDGVKAAVEGLLA